MVEEGDEPVGLVAVLAAVLDEDVRYALGGPRELRQPGGDLAVEVVEALGEEAPLGGHEGIEDAIVLTYDQEDILAQHAVALAVSGNVHGHVRDLEAQLLPKLHLREELQQAPVEVLLEVRVALAAGAADEGGLRADHEIRLEEAAHAGLNGRDPFRVHFTNVLLKRRLEPRVRLLRLTRRKHSSMLTRSVEGTRREQDQREAWGDFPVCALTCFASAVFATRSSAVLDDASSIAHWRVTRKWSDLAHKAAPA